MGCSVVGRLWCIKTQSLALIKCQICDQRNCLHSVIHRINWVNNRFFKWFLWKQSPRLGCDNVFCQVSTVGYEARPCCTLCMFPGLLLGKLLMQMHHIAFEHCWINQESTHHHHLLSVTMFDCHSHMQCLVFNNSMSMCSCMYCSHSWPKPQLNLNLLTTLL